MCYATVLADYAKILLVLLRSAILTKHSSSGAFQSQLSRGRSVRCHAIDVGQAAPNPEFLRMSKYLSSWGAGQPFADFGRQKTLADIIGAAVGEIFTLLVY